MVRVVRGQRVMLDFDLAQLYDVPTMRLNSRSAGTRSGSWKILRFPLRSKSLRT